MKTKKLIKPLKQVTKRTVKNFETRAANFVEFDVLRPMSNLLIEKLKESTYLSMNFDGYYDSYINKAVTVVLREYLTPFYKDFIFDVDKTLSICQSSIDEIKSSVSYYPELVNRTIKPGYYVVKLDHKTTLLIEKKSCWNNKESKKKMANINPTSFDTTLYIVGGNRQKWFEEIRMKIDTLVTQMIAPNQGDNRLKVSTMSSGEVSVNEITTRLMKHIVSPHKDEILEIIRKFKSQEATYKNLGIPHSLGFLLYGPPGTGKTVMAHAIANEFHMNCVDVTLDYFDANLGSGAFNQPNTVYIIDEIDSQLVNRALTTAEANTEASKMLTSQRLIKLLKAIDEMDNGSIAVATTNYPERLDAALKRSGRFGLQFEFPRFDREWAENMCKSRGLTLSDVMPDANFDKNLLTPADLEQLIIEKLIQDNCIVSEKTSMEDLGLEEEYEKISKEEETALEERKKSLADSDDNKESFSMNW